MARILIIDDDLSIRLIMTQILCAKGYEVAELDSGAKVVEALDEWSPDLVITDIMMPGATGQAVYNVIRQKAGDELPILVCSGTALRFRGSAQEDPLLGYISKPVHPKEFLDKIVELLEARRTLLKSKEKK